MKSSSGRRRASLKRVGEEAASAYLQERGFVVLARNYHTRTGEVDIVARQGDTVAFVEVKCRTQERFGTGVEAVDSRKLRRVARAARQYAAEAGLEDSKMRFDVIQVTFLPGENRRITHFENVWTDDGGGEESC